MVKFKFYAFKLSGIMLLVFALQIIFSGFGFTEIFVLNNTVWQGQYWRFISSIFLHGGIVHLFYNLFALVLFGSILEKLIGGRKFIVIFFITGILANLFSVNFYSSSLGASGAIFGIIGAIIVIKPLLPIWAFGLPMPIIFAGLLWGIGDLIGAYGFFAGNPIDNTGNLAHISGMLFGLIFGFFCKRKKKKKRKEKRIIDEKTVRKWEERNWGF